MQGYVPHWPPPPELFAWYRRVENGLNLLADELELDAHASRHLLTAHLPLCAWIDRLRRAESGPMVIGINGSQGSGKTTFCRFAEVLLRSCGWHVCSLSLDDLYLTREERRKLARDVHPLFETRGVPGTHDTAMGRALIQDLKQGRKTAIPRFDKARDDRAASSRWPIMTRPVDLILFEGWCLAAPPQESAALDEPVNRLEAVEDPRGIWRHHVNRELAGPYRELFASLDRLIMFKAPDFSMVLRWRTLQEHKLAARHQGGGIMTDQQLKRFIMFYERLTRHQLAVLPERVDLVCHLNQQQCIARIDPG